MTYNNKKVSITPDGMKVVIVSTVSTGTTGHYYFVFDRVTNEYIYKRF